MLDHVSNFRLHRLYQPEFLWNHIFSGMLKPDLVSRGFKKWFDGYHYVISRESVLNYNIFDIIWKIVMI